MAPSGARALIARAAGCPRPTRSLAFSQEFDTACALTRSLLQRLLGGGLDIKARRIDDGGVEGEPCAGAACTGACCRCCIAPLNICLMLAARCKPNAHPCPVVRVNAVLCVVRSFELSVAAAPGVMGAAEHTCSTCAACTVLQHIVIQLLPLLLFLSSSVVPRRPLHRSCGLPHRRPAEADTGLSRQ